MPHSTKELGTHLKHKAIHKAQESESLEEILDYLYNDTEGDRT